ncbi:MAG: hypothetical protein H0V30_10000 [Chitinophagaceae bacterium]|nr:hypothetical protein [Chitinophagaceae bacterium]
MQTTYNPFDEILTELLEIKQTIAVFRTVPTSQIEIIDRPELLKRLAITEPTAITWGRRGKIPEIRIGSAVRYNWFEVVKALEKKVVCAG